MNAEDSPTTDAALPSSATSSLRASGVRRTREGNPADDTALRKLGRAAISMAERGVQPAQEQPPVREQSQTPSPEVSS